MKYTIKIPEPCHEDWSKMTPTEKGKFCASCKKEVFDFTNYSDYELVRKLDRNESICGRFKETQLNKEIKSLKRRNHTKVGLAASFMALFSVSTPFFSQEGVHEIEVRDSISDNLNAVAKNRNDFITIKGVVFDDVGGLPGASIIIKGKMIGTETDFDGNFSIEIPKESFKEEVVLTFSFVGMKTKEIIINSKTNFLKVELNVDEDLMKNIVITALGWPTVTRKRSVLEKLRDSLHVKKMIVQSQ